VNAN